MAIANRGAWGVASRLILPAAGLCMMARVVSGFAQPPAKSLGDAATQCIQRFVDAREFQGSVLLARHDSVLFERTFVFSGEPLQISSLIGIGSITKTFTAAAIQRLEQQGRLRLDDRLSRFVPGFPRGDSITIEQLLAHTAGIPDYYSDPEYPKKRTQPMTPQTFAKWLATKRLDFAPGSQSRYSSSGYALLSYVVERASGMAFDSYVRHELIDPLGLSRTGALTAPRRVPGLAPGFDPGPLPEGSMQPVAFDWSWLVGSGSLYSTPRDLLRWTHAVLRDGFVDRRKHRYPYGWALRERHQQRVIEQTGRVPAGYAAKVSYLPEADLAVIVLANLQSEAAFRLADDLESLALGDTIAVTPLRPRVRLSESHIDSIAGRYEMFPGFVITVRAQHDGAWLAGPDGDFMPLDAENGTQFFFRLLDVPVDFARDSTTGSTVLVWNGRFRAQRLP
jgi:CubicO group peptidase (beta-lactamase class C family)